MLCTCCSPVPSCAVALCGAPVPPCPSPCPPPSSILHPHQTSHDAHPSLLAGHAPVTNQRPAARHAGSPARPGRHPGQVPGLCAPVPGPCAGRGGEPPAAALLPLPGHLLLLRRLPGGRGLRLWAGPALHQALPRGGVPSAAKHVQAAPPPRPLHIPPHPHPTPALCRKRTGAPRTAGCARRHSPLLLRRRLPRRRLLRGQPRSSRQRRRAEGGGGGEGPVGPPCCPCAWPSHIIQSHRQPGRQQAQQAMMPFSQQGSCAKLGCLLVQPPLCKQPSVPAVLPVRIKSGYRARWWYSETFFEALQTTRCTPLHSRQLAGAWAKEGGRNTATQAGGRCSAGMHAEGGTCAREEWGRQCWDSKL